MRRNTIIAGAVGAALMLFSLVVYAVTSSYSVGRADRIFDVMPSDEAMKKLEAAGITKSQVEGLMQNVANTSQPTDTVNYYLFQCDEQIKIGNVTSEQFLACADYVQGFYKDMAVFLNNSRGNIT